MLESLSKIAAHIPAAYNFIKGETPVQLFSQWRNWVKTWTGAFSRFLGTDISIN